MTIRQLCFSSEPIQRIFALHFGQQGVVSVSDSAVGAAGFETAGAGGAADSTQPPPTARDIRRGMFHGDRSKAVISH
jgi:hypothetical protein